MKLLTKTKEFEIDIIGISSFDYSLRIELTEAELNEAFSTFTNPEETSYMKRIWEDGSENDYVGYTKFISINQMPDGHTIVALSRG